MHCVHRGQEVQRPAGHDVMDCDTLRKLEEVEKRVVPSKADGDVVESNDAVHDAAHDDAVIEHSLVLDNLLDSVREVVQEGADGRHKDRVTDIVG
jgi:hypothetical protein